MARVSVEKNISYDDVKKLYYVNMDFGKNEAGKRVKKTETFKTKSEARQALKRFEGNKVAGNLAMPRQVTVLEWLNYWMDNAVIPNRAETTIYGYHKIIENHIGPILGNIPLQKLTPQQVQKYYTMKMNDVDTPLSSNTTRKHHDLLNTALKFAVRQDVLLRNPLDKVIPPKLKETEKRYYTPEDLSRLLTIVEGDRLEAVVKLAGYLGLRREEICGLKWEHIDFETHTIQIRNARTNAGSKVIVKDTKNRSSSRTLFMPNDLEETLLKVKDKQEGYRMLLHGAYVDSGYVVQWEDGRPYRPNYISELFTKFIVDHNLPIIVLHELRHTFATIANSKKIPLFDIGKALGHSTPSVTGRIYTHLLDKTHQETVQSVAESIKNEK